MYEVMIIDDDEEIRERLKLMIEWDRLEMRLSCEAGDSETAQELFLLYRPKIVITDINIPIINGLELAQKMAETDSEVRFIIITGYNDFEYVRSSVKLGAIDLISKPILPEEINKSLQAAAENFRLLRERQASSQAMTELLSESRPMLLEKYLSFLLQSRPGSQEDALKRLKTLQFPIENRYCAVALAAPARGTFKSEDTDLILVATKNMADDLLEASGFHRYTYYNDASALVCVASFDFQNGDELLESTLNKLQERMSFYFEVRIFAGIGRQVENPTMLSRSYQEAQTALNYQGILDSGTVVHYKNIKRMEAPVLQDTDRILQKALELLKNGDEEELSVLLSGLFNNLAAESSNGIDKVREFSFAYVAAVLSEYLALELDNLMESCTRVLGELAAATNTQDLFSCLFGLSREVMAQQGRRRSKSRNYVIDAAKEYMIENLSNEKLSLDMVSSHVGLSSVYLCRLFHKESGVSFTEFLNAARIEKAKKLLKETNLKVFEVSYQSGYSNPKHFSYMFRRLVGLTPLEYKNDGGDQGGEGAGRESAGRQP